ncbi:MAG: STAS domain-containing protein [bacterium]|nr:STAS domain-containing protein [bacterium]
MKITTRRDRDEDVTIIELEGKLTIGEGDVQLRDAIKELLDDGIKRILINLQGVKMMDSSGLGELVRVRASAMSAEATVKLLHVEDKVAEVLEMTRLIGVFETFDDEIDAIASFRG